QRQIVVICPGPDEVDRCQSYAEHAIVLPGIPLGVYAALMARAQAVVANDSGPMHMASAVGAPVLGIFGVGDPARTAPWGGHFIGGVGSWPTLYGALSAYESLLDASSEIDRQALLAA